MNSSASPSDVVIVVTFCRQLYNNCVEAGGAYDEVSREVRGLYTVLKHLKYEVEAPESPLIRHQSILGCQLAPMIGECDFTLRQLDELLQKYGRLATGGTSPASLRVSWDDAKFGTDEMDTLGEIRVRMISHKSNLKLFLDTMPLHPSRKITENIDRQQDQLDIILDKVDAIAARIGNKEGNIMTSYDNDDKEAWKQFRRELVAEGFSSAELRRHKDILRAYIREIDQKGLLDSPRTATPLGVNSQHWVESVHLASSGDAPPSFSSLGTSTDDGGTKEMMVRESNMKFPLSMKLEFRQSKTPMSGSDLLQPSSKDLVPNGQQQTHANQAQPTMIVVAPRLVASDEREVVAQKPESSSYPGKETDWEVPSKGAIIITSDLMKLGRTIQMCSSGSPSSLRSSLTSFHNDYDDDNETYRSMARRPKKQLEFSSSPSKPGAIPIPNATPRPMRSSFSSNSRPEFWLAPDEHGNEISPDAKWTKINRALVSPEVLKQDGRRYEARPEFVAILGVLSRSEIESLTSRSEILRATRYHQPPAEPEYPPSMPPRPSSVQKAPAEPSSPVVSHSRTSQGVDSPSLSSQSSTTDSSSDSEQEHHRQQRRQRESRTRLREDGAQDPYPNSWSEAPLVAPPSRWSPSSSNSTAHQAIFMSGGLGPGTQVPGHSQSWSYNYTPHDSFSQSHRNHASRYPNSLQGDNGAELAKQPRQFPIPEQEPDNKDSSRESGWSREWDRPPRKHHSGYKTTRDKKRDNSGTNRHLAYGDYYDKDRRRGGNGHGNDQARPRRWRENLAAAGIGGAAASLLNVLTEAVEIL